MSEVFNAVNANAAAARERENREAAARAQAERERIAEADAYLAKWHQEQAVKRMERNRRIDIRFGFRTAAAVTLGIGLAVAQQEGLIAEVLADPLMAALLGFHVFYTGAWWQFRFGKDGVLRVK